MLYNKHINTVIILYIAHSSLYNYLGNVPPYQPPYFGIVGERPTLEMMRETVVLDKSRPDTVGSWHSHPVIITIANEGVICFVGHIYIWLYSSVV